MTVTLGERLTGDEVIWRYMDLAKFHSLLSTKSLWMCRRDLLGDPFEGASPRWFVDWRVREGMEIATEIGVNSEQEYRETLREVGLQERRLQYANCWNQARSESMAMWSLYGSGKQCVAIRTSVGRLARSIVETELDIRMERVTYLPWKDKRWNSWIDLSAPQLKHESFQHEREIRVTYTVDQMAPLQIEFEVSGFELPVRLDSLFDYVMIAPNTPGHFHAAVTDILLSSLPRFRRSRILQSRMAGEPEF